MVVGPWIYDGCLLRVSMSRLARLAYVNKYLRDRHKHSNKGGCEKDESCPVDATKLLNDLGAFRLNAQEDKAKCDSQGTDQYVQSKDPSLSRSVSARRQIEVSGRHTHDVASTMAPPRIGPVTVPSAQGTLMNPNHCPRNRKGTRSVTMMSVTAVTPPIPIPCKHLPLNITVKLPACAAIRHPAASAVAHRVKAFLPPKMSDKHAQLG